MGEMFWLDVFLRVDNIVRLYYHSNACVILFVNLLIDSTRYYPNILSFKLKEIEA